MCWVEWLLLAHLLFCSLLKHFVLSSETLLCFFSHELCFLLEACVSFSHCASIHECAHLYMDGAACYAVAMYRKVLNSVLVALGCMAFVFAWMHVSSEAELEIEPLPITSSRTVSTPAPREFAAPAQSPTEQVIKKPETPELVIGGSSIAVEVADTPEERRQGLSGRSELPWGSGLFFVFEEAGSHGIWMPDMQFAIDVLWLDERMQVVHIVEEMMPESYPKVFESPVPAQYVLEVPAGFVAAHKLTVGEVARATFFSSHP